MKHVTKLLALILAIMMIASVTAACGEKSDKSNDSSAGSADKVPGEVQTWGEITVFVPDTMTLEGGDGTLDPDDQKTVWLKGKEKATDYIMITTRYDEAGAKNNIDTTKEMNQEYNPVDVSVSFNDIFIWNGVSYTSFGIDCTSLYSVSDDKVYYLMAGGFTENDDTMMEVLRSLV